MRGDHFETFCRIPLRKAFIVLFFFGAGGDDEVLGKVVEVGVEAEATGGKGWKGELVANGRAVERGPLL